jgi:tight adherence protein B
MSFLYENNSAFMFVIGAIVFALSYMWSDRIIQFLHSKSLGNRDYVVQKMQAMFIEVNQKKLTITMLLSSFGLGALFFLLLFPNIIIGLIIATIVTVFGWSVPRLIVDYMFEKRSAKFVDQMVDGMTIMSNGIAGGVSVAQAMERVAQNMANPISQEFDLVLSQNRLGLGLEECLNNLGQRIPTPDVQMFVLSVNILLSTGGNLAETFNTICDTIRERQKIQKKIEALTAQGLMQGIIISMVPFGLLLVFLVVDPGYVRPLFTTTLGIIFLMVMLGLQIIGGLMIRKIVKIKV